MIKNSILFCSLFISGLFFWGCSKPYQDALPSCQFVSATPCGQDSLLITGNATSSGASAMDYVGFAYSDQPNFNLQSNQILGSGTTGQFYAIITGYPDTTYYFECFVANDYGYATSTVFKYTVPNAAPETAPCTLNINTVIDNGTPWTMASITNSSVSAVGSYNVQATDATGYEVVNIYFNVVPVNGIYTTDNEQDFIGNPNNRFAVVITVGNYTVYTINSGGQVYVSQNKNGTTTLSFCSLTYTVSSSNISISGKITF